MSDTDEMLATVEYLCWLDRCLSFEVDTYCNGIAKVYDHFSRSGLTAQEIYDKLQGSESVFEHWLDRHQKN